MLETELQPNVHAVPSCFGALYQGLCDGDYGVAKTGCAGNWGAGAHSAKDINNPAIAASKIKNSILFPTFPQMLNMGLYLGITDFKHVRFDNGLNLPQQYVASAMELMHEKRRVFDHDYVGREDLLGQACKAGLLLPRERDALSEFLGHDAMAEKAHMESPKTTIVPQKAIDHHDIITPKQHPDVINPVDDKGRIYF